MITLILMEGFKCAIAIWFGLVLCRLTSVLENQFKTEPAKGRQLQYIKEHSSWLFILSIVGILSLISVGVVGYKLYNAQKFHIEIHNRVQPLEAIHASELANKGEKKS